MQLSATFNSQPCSGCLAQLVPKPRLNTAPLIWLLARTDCRTK